jgi:uncharacterized protein
MNAVSNSSVLIALAIALFREMPANVLLLDEKDARRSARRLSIPVLGTVGILVQARRKGIVTNLKEQLDSLQIDGGFRLSDQVYFEALRSVGEKV